jgi:hypothetical protein
MPRPVRRSHTPGTFGVYRLWMTQANINTWASRETSATKLDGTLVYGDFRVIYNADGRYRGSPFIRPGYNSPGRQPLRLCLGDPPKTIRSSAQPSSTSIPSNPAGTGPVSAKKRPSGSRNNSASLQLSALRPPLPVNGVKRGDVYADSQQPNSDYIRTWYPNDDRGHIFKIDDWFEFNDSVAMQFHVNARLEIPHHRRRQETGPLPLELGKEIQPRSR